MKNYNSKENKYTDIQSEDIRKRANECQNHYQEGITVKELAVKFKLSESRIRQYLKKQ
jgi:DNA-binding transcriptional regulator LsrR (DeoR family)